MPRARGRPHVATRAVPSPTMGLVLSVPLNKKRIDGANEGRIDLMFSPS
jgi:hypothetical protein